MPTLQRLVARADPGALERVRVAADKIGEQVRRAGDIVQRLRERLGRSAARPESISILIEEADGLALVGTHERGVDVRLHVVHELPRVFVDKVQVQQVVLLQLRFDTTSSIDCR